VTTAPPPPSRAWRVAVNTAAQFGSYAFNNILATIVSIVVVRHLGRSEYGVMAFVVSYLSLFQMVASIGADTVVIRDVSRRPTQASDLIGAALGLRLVLSAGAMVLASVLAPSAGADTRTLPLIVLESLTLLFSYGGLFLVLFNVELRTHVSNSILAVWSVAYTGLRLVIAACGGRVVHFLAADVVSAVVSLALSAWIAFRYSSLRPKLRFDAAVWRRLLSQGWPIALAGWLIALHFRIDQMLLFRMRGPTELGGYAVAVRMSEIWGVLTNVILTSLFPLLSRDAVDDRDRMERTYGLAYRYLYATICPVVLALVLYPRFVIELLFGPSFVDAAPALALLALAEVFVFANSVTYNVLFAMDRQREAALVAGASVAANTVLNLMWIPSWGATGSAAASLVSYAAVPVIAMGLAPLRRTATASLVHLIRPAAAIALAGLTIRLLALEPIPGLLLIALASPVALIAVGALGRSDLDLLRRAFAGR
jgi:O-antigen/teichoic acid export membrane protein